MIIMVEDWVGSEIFYNLLENKWICTVVFWYQNMPHIRMLPIKAYRNKLYEWAQP